MARRAARILVVDDDRAVRAALRINLTHAGYEVALANDGRDALALLHERAADLVLTDVKMPGMSGQDLLEQVRERWSGLPVIMMTGHGSVPNAVRAMRAGAADYIIKPVEKAELLVIIERALEQRALVEEVAHLRQVIDDRYGFENLIGATPAIKEVFRLVTAVASSDALVLLTGPTGTGKELFARAIHYRSPRHESPFVGVNCAAIPEGLLESELFGHEKGAFTGAVRQHRGKFEQADGGTLLLDEVGEIPMASQVRLLRVLESAELQRVGGQETLTVDVRVIAATNRDLRQEVREGRFRQDLYYRLNVFHIPIPPLRDRRDDVPLLVEHFIQKFADSYAKPARRLSPAILQRLVDYPWPGNIRELEHVIERAVILSTSEIIESVQLPEPDTRDDDLAPGRPGRLKRGQAIGEALNEFERELIIEALRAEQGVQARAARRLGISRSNLNYRIKKLGIAITDVVYD